MKSKQFRFFHSFSLRIYAAFVLCVLLLLLLNWGLNSFFFKDQYRKEKETLLIQEFSAVCDLPLSPPDLPLRFNHLSPLGVTVTVWTEHRVLFTNAQPLFTDPLLSSAAPLTLSNGSYRVVERPLDYSEAQSDSVLTLYGKTNSGLNILFQTSLSGAEKSTSISDSFLLWSAIITLAISCIVTALLTRSFTKPISRLSRIANRMANMDFSGRYEGHGHGELAELGNNLNVASSAMETALAELKTANARLLNEKEKSEKQNEARRSFISNVSHELKTPIALIQTYSEALKENAAETPEERDYYCGVIEDEASHLSQIISRMTMLMQLQSGNAELQIERFDLRDICQRLLERYSPLLEEKQVFVSPLPTESTLVWGDGLLIENVLTNYLTNALNHVEHGGTICLSWKESSADMVRITVFNSGSHIPEEDLPRIWESFYKVDKAHTRSYGGTGIGLSVVAAIMEVHRAAYGVVNTEDGVEFFFELPQK